MAAGVIPTRRNRRIPIPLEPLEVEVKEIEDEDATATFDERVASLQAEAASLRNHIAPIDKARLVATRGTTGTLTRGRLKALLLQLS